MNSFFVTDIAREYRLVFLCCCIARGCWPAYARGHGMPGEALPSRAQMPPRIETASMPIQRCPKHRQRCGLAPFARAHTQWPTSAKTMLANPSVVALRFQSR